MFDKISKKLEMEGPKTDCSNEEDSCLQSSFVFPPDALYIKNGIIHLQGELAKDDNFLVTLEDKIREPKSEKEKYCEQCDAIREFQYLVGTTMLHLVQRAFEYDQAKERSEQVANQLLKVQYKYN